MQNCENDKIKNEKWHMNQHEFEILWTALWFIMITILCIFFHNGNFLWLLILWIFRNMLDLNVFKNK